MSGDISTPAACIKVRAPFSFCRPIVMQLASACLTALLMVSCKMRKITILICSGTSCSPTPMIVSNLVFRLLPSNSRTSHDSVAGIPSRSRIEGRMSIATRRNSSSAPAIPGSSRFTESTAFGSAPGLNSRPHRCHEGPFSARSSASSFLVLLISEKVITRPSIRLFRVR